MKKSNVKKIAVGMSLALSVSMMGGLAVPVMAEDDDKTITWWNLGTEGADKAWVEETVAQFEANTDSGYTVESVAFQNDKYKEKLVIAMSSGECPDMYLHWTGGPMNEYIESGFAQPVDEYYEEYGLTDVYMDGAIEQCKYNGSIYAVPAKNISVAGIYYNKALFEEYGLEIPTTVSELETVCDTLLENGIIPFTLANSTKWTGSMFFQCLATRYGGTEPFQKAAAGEGSFDDECFKYAGEKIQEWVEKGYFPEGFNSMDEDDGQAAQLFYTEQAAMYLIGSWRTASFKTDTADGGSDFYDQIGWFSFPAVDGSDADASILNGTLGDNFVSFNCTGEKLDAAFELASYLSSDEVVQVMLDNGNVPPIKGIEEKVTDPLSLTIVEAANNASEVQLWYDQYLSPSVANAHLDGNQEVFGLTMTPEEANQKMQEASEEYLAG